MSYYFLYQKKGVPTWLAYLFILGLTLTLTLALRGKPSRIISRASKNLVPNNVTVSNLTNNSAVITFVTKDDYTGLLTLYNDSSQQVVFDVRDQSTQTKRRVHYFLLSNLSPNKVYRFQVRVEGELYPPIYDFRTLAQDYPTVSNAPIFGKVLANNLQPANEVLIIAKITGTGQSFAALSKSTGEWLLSFPMILDADNNELTLDNQLIQLKLASSEGKSTATVFYTNAQPVKTMVLGNDYDFRKTNSVLGIKKTQSPKLISFPPNNGFIAATLPTFRGQAKANSLVQIQLEPVSINMLVTVNNNGEWRFTPSEALPPGKYRLVAHSEGKSAEVQFTIGKSGEAVLGDATPSATITTHPSATPTPTRTISQAITPTLSATTPSPTLKPTIITPTVRPSMITPTVTKPVIPELGVTNNLVILFASGLSLLGLFLVLY